MDICLKSALSRVGLIIVLMVCAFIAKAQNYTDFFPITLPSPHLMEKSIAFGHDDKGQNWLVTENGLSVFRDIQFVSFRSFDLVHPVIAAEFSDDYLYIATIKRVLRVSLNSPTLALSQIWPSVDAPLPSQKIATVKHIYQSTNPISKQSFLYVQTESSIKKAAIGQVDLEQNSLFEPIKTIELDTQPIEIIAHQNQLFLLFERHVEQYDSTDNSWQSFGVPQRFDSFAVTEQSLVFRNLYGQLYALDRQSGKLEHMEQLANVDELIMGEETVFLRQGEFIKSFDNPNVIIREANFSDNIYVDAHRNIWLSTPFDIQVSWWQPLNIDPHPKPDWGDLIHSSYLTQTGNYAIKNGVVYQHQPEHETKWRAIWQKPETETTEFERIFETQHHIWLTTQSRLLVIDKNSLTISYNRTFSRTAQFVPFDANNIVMFKQFSVSLIGGDGQQTELLGPDQCTRSCLIPWQLSNALVVGNSIYLATTQGLHKFDKTTLNLTTMRLDYLNQQTPILSVLKAEKGMLWLVYPNKVALFDPVSEQSEIYFGEFNRIFDAMTDSNLALIFNSQRGWFRLNKSTPRASNINHHFVVKQVINEPEHHHIVDINNRVKLAEDTKEIQLAFNVAKQHPAQQMKVRFKYSDESNWSVMSMFNPSLTLKNLRTGANQLELQARLEGKPWEHAKTINYILPHQFFQTSWVVGFVASFLLILLGIIVYERLGRVKIAFDSVAQEAFILSLLDTTKDGVWIANKDREIQSVNQSFIDITGYSLGDVEGRSFRLYNELGRNHELESLIWQEVVKNGFWVGEVWSKKNSGEKVSLDLSVSRVETENRLMSKSDVKFVGVFSDITHRKNSENELRLLATRDPLTKLANRTLFTEHVQHTIDMTTPSAPNFAVLFLDLDNFKKVNESLGPLKGDEFIVLVAERITKSLVKGATLARIGGDEFALLIPNQLFSGVPAFFIKRIAKDIQRELMPAFWLGETEISISASIGAAIYPNHGDKPETLMRCADTALNRVKVTGRNNCLIYDELMDDSVNDKLSLESELIAGLNRNEFVVYYQPKFRIKENEICGFEALIRWQNPNRGLVPPDHFISIAEDNGLIRQLDFYVLKSVCRQIKEWLNIGVMRGKVAVNISALNFQQADFSEKLLELVATEGELWQFIELEITETAMMRDPERALKSAQKLRDKGLSIALDDFGTGHSSLGYLKTFPIDRIKIDRTFVKDIEFDEQDRNITSVIVQLAKHLGIAVIAEGVETEQQAYLMHVMGCNEIQGYYISRPIPASQIQELLAKKKKIIGRIER